MKKNKNIIDYTSSAEGFILTQDNISKIIKKVKKKMKEADKIYKNGFYGYLGEENIVIYCNEKDKNRGNFLFKCCKGCKHNPF